MKEKYKKGDVQKELKEIAQRLYKEWHQTKGFLLCVSKTAQNPVMWAHYTDNHKGAVIGIDFNSIFRGLNWVRGVKMERVRYSKKRPRIDVVIDTLSKAWGKAFNKTVLTKSDNWSYEQEFRTIFLDDILKDFREQNLASLKELDGKKTWLLRLNPSSIKEVVFGLDTEESLKSDIRKLKSHPELQHIKLYQATESDTYIFNLIDLSA